MTRSMGASPMQLAAQRLNFESGWPPRMHGRGAHATVAKPLDEKGGCMRSGGKTCR